MKQLQCPAVRHLHRNVLVAAAVLLTITAVLPEVAAQTSDWIFVVENRYTGSTCSDKPYQIDYYFPAAEYASQLGICRAGGFTNPEQALCISGDAAKTRGSAYKQACTTGIPAEVETVLPLPGYLCLMLYDDTGRFTKCTPDTLIGVQCYTTDDLGKAWPGGGFTFAPVPADAGIKAKHMTITQPGAVQTFKNGKCEVYQSGEDLPRARSVVW